MISIADALQLKHGFYNRSTVCLRPAILVNVLDGHFQLFVVRVCRDGMWSA